MIWSLLAFGHHGKGSEPVSFAIYSYPSKRLGKNVMTKARIVEMDVFVVVGTSGSFSEAGRRLGLTPSAVSKLVARLEARLGVRLVTRSTHGLALTVEGCRFSEASQRILRAIDQAEAEVSGDGVVLTGPLRVSCSGPLAFHVIAPLLPNFLELYPDLTLEFLVSDQIVDLLEQRVDVALRIGTLKDSGLKLKRLGRTEMLLVASPSYLSRVGKPTHPEELRQHRLLRFPSHRTEADTRGSSVLAPLTDSGELLRHFALNGLGIALLARFHITDDIREGRLVAIEIEGMKTDYHPVSAVYLSHRQPAPRVVAFIDYMLSRIRERL
jgi:DNA-binding transcriptional LysR family regulator